MSFNNSGGYMDNSYDSSNTNAGSGYTKKPLGEQTMRPLTIKQIKGATSPQEGTFKVDNSNITQITFIGVIRNIQELATNYVYTVEDGTGAIDVRKWVEQNETPDDADARRGLLVDTYVRVNGRLNSFSNRISIVAHSMRPITNFNEITFHYLDAINTHLMFSKPGSSLLGATNNDHMQIDATTSLIEKVSQAIKSYDDSAEGASIKSLVERFGGLHTESEIRDSVEFLLNDGQCYATTDSDHWKSCLP
ncbi:Replication factor A protein 2 [Mucor circinelloides]